VSLIGKGSERAKESHGEQPWEESDRKEGTQWRLIMSITWRYLTIIQKMSSKLRSERIIYSKTGGMCWHCFLKKQVKRDKEKWPMKNRVQTADWGKRRAVNKIHWWSEGFNPDSGPIGQSNQSRISRWRGRMRYSRRNARRKAWWRRINLWLATGQESFFRKVFDSCESPFCF
jgi:hypothetical protein